MSVAEFAKSTDFTIYKQVVRGSFNPLTVSKSQIRSSFNLVSFANTETIYSAPTKEDAAHFISKINLTNLGYHSTADIDINYINHPGTNGFQVVIKPNRIYELSEDISLPEPPDEKGKIYLDFFSDEFERVKIRAEYIMYGDLADKKIRSYACRNLQLLRKLYHDSRISFNKLSACSCNDEMQSDLFIMYALNLFIIRCIVFYTKFFKPFLNEEPPEETDLRNAFHSEMPRMLKYPWLFIHRPPLYEVLADCSGTSNVCETNVSYQKIKTDEKPDIPESLLKEALEVIQMKGCIKLNCPSNAFINEFYKMINEYKTEDMPWLSVEPKNLIRLLNYICIDNTGQPLNASTIRTVLKPSNITKRPGKID